MVLPSEQVWLNSVVDHLEVRPEKTRLGMVSFSDTAVKEFDLDTFKRKEDLKQVSETYCEFKQCTNGFRIQQACIKKKLSRQRPNKLTEL